MTSHKIKAHFIICDVFRITGRGLVFVGVLSDDGSFAIGDYIEFIYESVNYSLKIIGIDMPRRSEPWQKQKYGILMRCKDEEEETKLRELLKGEIPAVIYEVNNG